MRERAMADDLSDDGLSTIPETKTILNTSTSTMYRLIEAGKLDAIKLGTATRITNRSIKALIAGAPRLMLRRHKRTAQAT
jgi:excisionase family DNA binding protein